MTSTNYSTSILYCTQEKVPIWMGLGRHCVLCTFMLPTCPSESVAVQLQNIALFPEQTAFYTGKLCQNRRFKRSQNGLEWASRQENFDYSGHTGLHTWLACSVVLTDAWSPNLPGRIGQLSMDMEVWTTWVYMNSAIHHNPCPGSRGFFVTFLKERKCQWSGWTMISNLPHRLAPEKILRK